MEAVDLMVNVKVVRQEFWVRLLLETSLRVREVTLPLHVEGVYTKNLLVLLVFQSLSNVLARFTLIWLSAKSHVTT